MEFTNQEEGHKRNVSTYGIFFLRQFFCCSAVVLNFFIFGLYMGATTVIVPQLRREANSTDSVTLEMASWFSSMLIYSAIPWGFVLPLLAYRYGRKHLLILVSLNVLISNAIFYCSRNIAELIISQATLGILVASISTVSMMVVSEYTSAKYRGLILTIQTATFYWGIWVSNVIGSYSHWRNIGIVIFVCGIYNLSSILGCESPYWLATKGRFDECAKTHRWLKGTDEDSEKELNKLILLQQQLSSLKSTLNDHKNVNFFVKIFKILRYRRFYLPFLYTSLLSCLFHLSGKTVCSVYAIDILKKITSSEKRAYEGMLILDGVTVVGMYIGCILCKYLTRRIQLLAFSSAALCFLYLLSAYLYMIKFNIILENNYISLVFLVGFSLNISCGPAVIAGCCLTELAPLRHRSFFVFCISLFNNILFATSLKVATSLFIHCGTHGAFLFNAVATNISICLLYKLLPETKDKTIQDIQDHIAGVEHHTATTIELFPLNKREKTNQQI